MRTSAIYDASPFQQGRLKAPIGATAATQDTGVCKEDEKKTESSTCVRTLQACYSERRPHCPRTAQIRPPRPFALTALSAWPYTLATSAALHRVPSVALDDCYAKKVLD